MVGGRRDGTEESNPLSLNTQSRTPTSLPSYSKHKRTNSKMGSPRSSRKTISHRNNNSRRSNGSSCGNTLLGILVLLMAGSLYLMIFPDSGDDYGGDATKHLKTLESISKSRAFRAPAAVNVVQESPSSDEEESDQDRDASDKNQDSEEESDHHKESAASEQKSSPDAQNNSEEEPDSKEGDNSPDEENGEDPSDDPDEGNEDPDEPGTTVEANGEEDEDQDSVSDEENGDAGEDPLGEDQNRDSKSASADSGEKR